MIDSCFRMSVNLNKVAKLRNRSMRYKTRRSGTNKVRRSGTNTFHHEQKRHCY